MLSVSASMNKMKKQGDGKMSELMELASYLEVDGHIQELARHWRLLSYVLARTGTK